MFYFVEKVIIRVVYKDFDLRKVDEANRRVID